MRITRKVQNFCQNNTAFFRDNRHFFELALSEKDASYEKLSSVSRGLCQVNMRVTKNCPACHGAFVR